MENTKTVWDFVEKYYPNYTSSDEISENDDLHKIVNGEINGQAEEIYNELKEEFAELFGIQPEEFQILEVAQNKLNESNACVFEKAIEGYLETLN